MVGERGGLRVRVSTVQLLVILTPALQEFQSNVGGDRYSHDHRRCDQIRRIHGIYT